ncbi:MAG: hypothetical protein U0872_12555 [Planctomycetaceae bacterium]
MTTDSGVLDQPAVTADSASESSGAETAQAADRCDCPPDGIDGPELSEDEYQELLGKLPAEIGTMLMIAGVAGVLLPGPIGTPMLLAGAVVVWPKTFAPVERAFAKYFPKLHREGVQQVKQYVADLNRRFPGTT